MPGLLDRLRKRELALRDPTWVELHAEPDAVLEAMASGEMRTTPLGQEMARQELEVRRELDWR